MGGVDPGGTEARAGGRVLRLLSDVLNVSILRLLARGPLPTPELGERVGPASRTTRFSRLRDLEALGVIRREKRGGSPPVTYCMLSASGTALLPVARRFAAWLNQGPVNPGRPRQTGDAQAIKALAAGWHTTALRWLAEGPRTVTDLASRCSPEATYNDVRRTRLALADAGLVEPVRASGRGSPYGLSQWARCAVAPLAAAARWERNFLAGAAGIFTATEGETLLLLGLALIDLLPGALSGACMLQLEEGSGVRVEIEDGRIVSSVPVSENGHLAHVRGSTSAWLDALLDGGRDGLEMRGNTPRLPALLTVGLQEACS